jgi:hypothetical protein
MIKSTLCILSLTIMISSFPEATQAEDMMPQGNDPVILAGASPAGSNTSNSGGANSETSSLPGPAPAVNASTSLAGITPQQTGVIQVNNAVGLSTLSYPSCGGTCAFAITRVIPMNNDNASWEAVAGVIWQINSPDKILAKSQQLVAQAQSRQVEDQSTLVLTERLAEAIETGKYDRANLLAMMLAKRLGYRDYQALLQSAKKH